MDKETNTQPELNVFFAIGRFFIPYFTVAVTSLLENNRDLNIKVFLIHDFEEVSLLDEVQAFLQDRFQLSLHLIHQDINIFETYKVGDHVSLNTYLRLLLPDLIPGDIDSGLFLDSDLVITGSLTELANLTFEEKDGEIAGQFSKYLYAVPEIPEQNIANSLRMSRMGYPTRAYFNAGVMLVNLKQWRAEQISRQLLQLAGKHMDKLVFWDQDVLNMYFADRWGALAPRYNALHLFRRSGKMPSIIHYAGASKPWNYCNQHPYKSQYFKYLKLTPFKNNRYTDFKIKDVPRKLYLDFRHLLGYVKNINTSKAS